MDDSTHRNDGLVERMRQGDRRALARLITLVENRQPGLRALMHKLYALAGNATLVGITGPPGAGKSTLSDRLIACLRQQGKSVGVIAVDPSSPFSGGALLGDRIRMQRHFLDEGVFIRSLSTRGSHGGIARATRDVARVLDASGKDFVLIESVGVGQTELDIMRLASTVVVVLVPEAGDAVQVMKAGLLEIAHIFVVNKADRGGAEQLKSEIEGMLQLRPASPWPVPVLVTEATRDTGTSDLLTAILDHERHLRATEDAERGVEQSREHELLDIADEELARRARDLLRSSACQDLRERVRRGDVDPYTGAAELLRALAGPGKQR